MQDADADAQINDDDARRWACPDPDPRQRPGAKLSRKAPGEKAQPLWV